MDSTQSTPTGGLSSSASHQRTQKSTTLNRRYVEKPVASATIDSVAKRRAEDLKRRQALAEKINRERLSALKSGKSLNDVPTTSAPKPLSTTIEKSLAAKPSTVGPRDIKDSAIKTALKSVDMIETSDTARPTATISTKNTFGAKRLILAFGCAALAVGVIGYFVSVNTPDLSVRVAAMQSGIEATYPSYIPRGYSLSDIVSEEGKLTMTFENSDKTSFTLSEEKSAWDNEALESNYVHSTWGSNYTSIREQGITIFISGSDATWVNGGLVYKIDASGNNLTKKQIKSIVTSL
ncbi:DUF4367 domain-containing protein [Candidatus Saccharibacteria bacterium]|nr:DUF4367 domain-containing protein [Candidatus Saccharibacteria bacterium]MBQ3464403.1 DUF4367 domain-containing protein [Candidatus Saccharibacteria bacterium]